MNAAVLPGEFLDALVARASKLVRPLPSLASDDAAAERQRLVHCLARGDTPIPTRVSQRPRLERDAYRLIDAARALCEVSPLGDLYLARLDELELDLAIADAWGDPARVRPIAVRRYGRGDDLVATERGAVPLVRLARSLLASLPREERGERVLPPLAGRGEPSVAALIERAALAIGLEVQVRVEPRLAALAATGERTVFLAARSFTVREAQRLVAHEVFGHLVSAANARAQPLRLLSVGLAGSFADQEGASLLLEEHAGVLCAGRLRILAARVLATEALHAGAEYGETARSLVDDHGFLSDEAIAITERTYRGGGVARDAGYLLGFLRVRRAVQEGVELDELRMGRVSVAAVPRLRALAREGQLLRPRYRPSLSLSRRLTLSGTSAETSAPSEAASFTMLELT